MIRNLLNFFKSSKAPLVPNAPAMDSAEGWSKKNPFNATVLFNASINTKQVKEIVPPTIMPGVIPEAVQSTLAMDSCVNNAYVFANQGAGYQAFPGYAYLAQLAQIVEYRKLAEIPAKEMTRKWIKIVSKGDGDVTKKIAQIEAVMINLNVRGLFRDAAIHDGLYGRGQIYIDVKSPRNGGSLDESAELKMPLLRNKAKITKGSLKAFKLIDPVWTYPFAYNSDNPLRQDFYRPQAWFVMGKEVHLSRLLNFVSRPVPDILKPAYVFGGVSMSQLADPYVNNWIRCRNSISDMVHSFSVSGIKTNLAARLQQDPSGNSLFNRLQMFNMARDNRGVFALDKDTEDFFQFNTPLGGLNELQVEAINMLCYVSNIPPVKMFGTAASGLNASDEGTVKVFYDFIHSEQEDVYRHPLTQIFEIIQLSEFGEIDPDITFEFEPLWEPNGTELAAIRKSDSDGAVAMVGAGILAPEEVRASLANSQDSGYESINVSDIPEPPAAPDTDNLDEPDTDENDDDEVTPAAKNDDA